MFQNIWNWIVTNHAVIRDLLWIVFTLIATIVAILTYRRARFTLLQPLRTEVIKRQTELLVELLDFLNDDGASLLFKVDYHGIVICNCYLHMKEFGFIFRDNKLYDEVEKVHSGFLLLKESGRLSSFELPNSFEPAENHDVSETAYLERSKQIYQEAKNGIVDIEYLYITKRYQECQNSLARFIDNPFLPSGIRQLLVQLDAEIKYNLKVAMKLAIEQFLIKLCAEKVTEENPLSINPTGVYNDFNRMRKTHLPTIKKVLSITREYLMVDKKWS